MKERRLIIGLGKPLISYLPKVILGHETPVSSCHDYCHNTPDVSEICLCSALAPDLIGFSSSRCVNSHWRRSAASQLPSVASRQEVGTNAQACCKGFCLINLPATLVIHPPEGNEADYSAVAYTLLVDDDL